MADHPKRLFEPVGAEEIESARRRAAELRRLAESPVAQLTPAEQLLVSASVAEETARAELNLSIEQGWTERADEARRKLARALRDQGRYAESYILEPTESRARGMEAVERPDTDFDCGCEDDEVERDGEVFHVSRWLARKPVYSVSHQQEATLWMCVKCGFLNLSPLTPPGYTAPGTRTKVTDLQSDAVQRDRDLLRK